MVEAIPDEVIFAYYRGRCVLCWVRPAVTIHEIEPRSKRPKTWREFENRAPLDAYCHAAVTANTGAMAERIRENRKGLVHLLYGDRPPSVRDPRGTTNPFP